ncbi:PIG-L deacetylase family protein [Microbacterium sp. USTB-Y]|uniref:PIG-L deacetylase family protein n=1 Tax=Microbacterium sp. USTB-Y TaxID=2823692 RepID=UPI00203D56DF|nr:PIG-L deacetylase family protein [Microbacterium sp. USTB-Y]
MDFVLTNLPFLVLIALSGGACLLLLATRRSARWFERRFRKGHVLRGTLAVALVLILSVIVTAPPLRTRGTVLVLFALAIVALLVVTSVAAVQLRRRGAPARSRRRILAIGAHPDDIELACGATLAKLADRGHEIRTVVMTAGSSGGDAPTRLREAHRGSRHLGAGTTDVHELRDTRLARDDHAMVQIIERAIEDFAPDLVLTHSKNDYHQDHEAVHFATLRAARRHGSVICFESPSATGDFAPVLYVDVTEHLEVKVDAVELHQDQRGKPYMAAERVRAVAAFRGAQARARFAEGFEVVRLQGFATEGL